mgnify:FL=1
MKYLQFCDKINTDFFPVMTIEGEDAFLRSLVLFDTEKSLHVALKDLNYTVLEGDDVSVADILALANAFPAFSPKRMIIVRDFKAKKLSDKNREKLALYCKNPNDTTCLAFVYSVLTGETEGFDTTVVDCSKLDAYAVTERIIALAQKGGKKISRKTAQRIAEYCDRDMYAVTQSINKLIGFCDQEITDDAVEQLVPKTAEYVVFDLTNAITARDGAKAVEVCRNMLLQEEPAKIFAAIYGSVRRMFYCVNSTAKDDELAKKLSVKPYAVAKAKEQGARFGVIKLKKALDVCFNAENSLKNFDGNAKNIVFDTVLELCNL